MPLQKVIRYISLLLILLTCNESLAQIDSVNIIRSPYRKERNKHFEFGVFKRGYSSDSLKLILDKLEQKRKQKWNRSDSLNFAKTTAHAGNYKLAGYYFSYLNPSLKKEKEYWWDYIMVYVMNEKFTTAIEKVDIDVSGIYEFSEIYFLKRILIGKINQQKNNKWHKTNSVLEWNADSTLQEGTTVFQTSIINPIVNLDAVLKRFIHHIHEDDPIISRTCFELGIIMENYFSMSQTYVAMSLARHYNKRDKEILANIKRVKSKLLFQKYKIPNFRKYFPRIEYWRFDYDILKEKVIESKKNKTLQAPVFYGEKKKKIILPFNPDLISVFGIAFIFLITWIFLRSKRKK